MQPHIVVTLLLLLFLFQFLTNSTWYQNSIILHDLSHPFSLLSSLDLIKKKKNWNSILEYDLRISAIKTLYLLPPTLPFILFLFFLSMLLLVVNHSNYYRVNFPATFSPSNYCFCCSQQVFLLIIFQKIFQRFFHFPTTPTFSLLVQGFHMLFLQSNIVF